jgi:hypothetical protein
VEDVLSLVGARIEVIIDRQLVRHPAQHADRLVVAPIPIPADGKPEVRKPTVVRTKASQRDEGRGTPGWALDPWSWDDTGSGVVVDDDNDDDPAYMSKKFPSSSSQSSPDSPSSRSLTPLVVFLPLVFIHSAARNIKHDRMRDTGSLQEGTQVG